MLTEFNKYIDYNNIKASYDFIKEQIKDTEWQDKVYAVGGYVRDELLGNVPKDLDLMIDKNDGGIEFADWLTNKLGIFRAGKNPVVYPRFGTAMFTLRKQKYNGQDLSYVQIECVMPRIEKYSLNSRKPDIEFTTLKKDAERRDLTINALFKRLSDDKILDFTNMGKEDIKNKIIRSPLNPDIIFAEDPLRMLRCIRTYVKYDNWTLPMFMIRSLKKNAKLLENISKERIQEELDKMLLTDNPDKAIRLLQILGLSKYIFPELDKLIKLQQNKYHKYDAMKHTLEVLRNTPKDLITRLSALLHDIGKHKTREVIDDTVHFFSHEEIGAYMARDILHRLRYPREICDAVFVAIKNHMRIKDAGDDGKVSDKTLRKLKMDLGPYLEKTLDLIHADNISHVDWANMPNQIPNIRKRFDELDVKDKGTLSKPPLDGKDIMEILGVKGAIVGRIKKGLADMYLNDPHMSREEAEEIIKYLYRNDSEN
jgi:putative nucleotidyltransferase with HDIG domain